MEITPNPKLRTGSLPPDASPAEVRNWRVGQVLSAVATSADRGGSADLRIGGQTYRAQVPFTVQSGDRMLLEVIRAGGTPLLRPMGAERSPDPVQAALRAALPRQGALTPLLANLAQLAKPQNAPPLHPLVLEAARTLFQRLATVSQVSTADGLRRAAANAGTQLEAKLAQAASGRTPAAPLGDDFKAGLLRLRQAAEQALRASPPPATAPSLRAAAPAARTPEVRTLPLAVPTNQPAAAQNGRPTNTAAATGSSNPTAVAATVATVRVVAPLLPPLTESQPQPQGRAAPFPALLEPAKFLQGLLQQVESSLARLQLNQLASQHTDGDQRQVWLLELPVRRDQATLDLLHLRIERENESGSGTARRQGTGWTVQVALDLDGLGPVQARIGLRNRQVSTAFQTEREGTSLLFRRHLDELRTQMEAAGLDVAAMSCQVGQTQPPPTASGTTSGLVDEQA